MMKKFAYSQWSWGIDGKENFIRACEDLSRAGCYGIEGVSGFADLFGGFEGYDKACRDYGMTTASVYFFLSGDFEKDVTELLDKVDYIVKTGTKTVTVQGVFGIAHPTQEDLDYMVRTVSAIAKILKPYGIRPCLHPHHNTPVVRESEIDYFMEHTDPETVGLCPDTAHLVVGGCDPVKICEKYADRIWFTHLKDITLDGVEGDLSEDPTVYGRFRELGEGDVDFHGIFRVLKAAGYDGWLCVELDGSRTTNYDSAVISMKYLDENW